MCSSDLQIQASVEARMYSLGTMLQVLSTMATMSVAVAPHQKRRWLWLVVVTLASIYTHHFLALTAGINAMWLLWVVTQERKSGLRYWMTAVGCVALLWIPGLLLWWIQLNRVHKEFWIQPMTMWSVSETCFDFFFSPPPGRRSDFHLAGLVPAIVVAWLMLQLLPRMRITLSLLWMQAIFPLAAIAVVSLQTPLWESRYFRFSHVSLLMCIALSLWTISQRTNLRIALCVVAMGVSLAGSIAFWDWRDIPNRQAVRGAMEVIAKADEKSDASPGIHQRQVVVLSPIDFIIARYYARQMQWPNDQVKLWTGKERLPGDAVHLLKRTDWWEPDSNSNPEELIWVLWTYDSFPDVADLVPLGEQELEFRSDTFLGEWTIHAAPITKERLQQIAMKMDGVVGI